MPRSSSSVDTTASRIIESVRAGSVVVAALAVLAPGCAYLRYQATWYGSGTQGLARFWRRLPSLALGRRATRDDLFGLLEGAIHGTVAAGPSRDGTETWELAGTVDPLAVRALLRTV